MRTFFGQGEVQMRMSALSGAKNFGFYKICGRQGGQCGQEEGVQLQFFSDIAKAKCERPLVDNLLKTCRYVISSADQLLTRRHFHSPSI